MNGWEVNKFRESEEEDEIPMIFLSENTHKLIFSQEKLQESFYF